MPLTWVLLRHDAQLVKVEVMPNLLHVVPVCHDAVLDRVPKPRSSASGHPTFRPGRDWSINQ